MFPFRCGSKNTSDSHTLQSKKCNLQTSISYRLLFLREVNKGYVFVVFYEISSLQDINGLMVMTRTQYECGIGKVVW